MKKTFRTLLLALTVLTAPASTRAAVQLAPLELELDSVHYAHLISQLPKPPTHLRNSLDTILDIGKRNLDWLSLINSRRDAGHQISFTSEATQIAYPIESPRFSNPTIIETDYKDILAGLPNSFKKPLLDMNSPLPVDAPLADDEYILWGAKLDRIYQAAARWRLQEPAMGYYRANARNDVRGYVALSKESDLDKKLKAYGSLNSDVKDRIRSALIGMCFNTRRSRTQCATELDRSITPAKGAAPFYQRYFAASHRLYEGYFRIGMERSDVQWTARDPKVLSMPFATPTSQLIQEFLVGNIEDEWRWGDWALKLNFIPGAADTTAHVVFKPGVTPNVNGLGGSRITMDANQPLTEYNVRWTIRHEFGHVLGFPDCYAEFFTDDEGPTGSGGVMISYQIDITDLMCSRRGKLKERHYNDMKTSYYR